MKAAGATDKELAVLLARACQVFGYEAVGKVLDRAVTVAADLAEPSQDDAMKEEGLRDSNGGASAIRAAFLAELQRMLETHWRSRAGD